MKGLLNQRNKKQKGKRVRCEWHVLQYKREPILCVSESIQESDPMQMLPETAMD